MLTWSHLEILADLRSSATRERTMERTLHMRFMDKQLREWIKRAQEPGQRASATEVTSRFSVAAAVAEMTRNIEITVDEVASWRQVLSTIPSTRAARRAASSLSP
jgi:hypothetical protein